MFLCYVVTQERLHERAEDFAAFATRAEAERYRAALFPSANGWYVAPETGNLVNTTRIEDRRIKIDERAIYDTCEEAAAAGLVPPNVTIAPA